MSGTSPGLIRLPKRPKGTPVGRKPLITATGMEQNGYAHEIRPARSVGFANHHRWQMAARLPHVTTKHLEVVGAFQSLAAGSNTSSTGAAQPASFSKTMKKVMEERSISLAWHASTAHPPALSPSHTDKFHTHLHPDAGCINCTTLLRLHTFDQSQLWTKRTHIMPLRPAPRQQAHQERPRDHNSNSTDHQPY